MSDWSSDVCSSDLLGASRPDLGYAPRGRCKRGRSVAERHHQTLERVVLDEAVPGGRHCRDDVLGELVDADPPERTDQPAGDRGVTAIQEPPEQVRRPQRAAKHCPRSEEHTSELQSLMRISSAVFCLKKKRHNKREQTE